MTKRQYLAPNISIYDIKADVALMVGSGEHGTQVYDDYAGQNVGGLSRRRRTAWDDEEDEEEY